jgi:cytoskeletal protein RodZ
MMRPGDVEVLEVGNSLQEARRRRGVALSDAEAATMIRSRYLDALEHERFELLPDGPYARSFLREYAEFLGLDGDILAAEYDLRFAPEPPPPDPPPSTRRELEDLFADIPIVTPLLGLCVIVLVGVGVWLLGRSRAEPVSSAPPAQVVVQTPTTTPTQQPTPAGHIKPAVVQTATRPPLTLTASHGSCWLSVHLGSGTGKTVYEGTLQPGETVRFGLQSPLWIRIGAPWNVEAVIGSRSMTASLPALTGNVLVSRGGVHSTA